MKILHVIDSAGLYGAEVMLLCLMEEHQKMAVEPFLLSMEESDNAASSDSLAEEALSRGLKAVKFKPDRGYSFKTAENIWRFAEEMGADIIHSHGYKGNILLGSLSKCSRKRPVVSTKHGWTSTRMFTKIWFYTLLDKFFLKRMDAVVNVNDISPSIGNDREFVIENGIPELTFESITNDEPVISFCREGFIIGTVSRLSEEKGLTYLVEAMSLLVKKGVDAKAIIIGEGPQRAVLEEAIRCSNLSDRFLLAGYKNKAYNYLPLFDLFVLPSLTEGLPITILEAMQAGKPIIASRVGGIPRVLDNGRLGMLIESGSPESIVDAISSLYHDSKRRISLGKDAREAVLTRYSSKRMAEEYIKVYEEVLNKWKH